MMSPVTRQQNMLYLMVRVTPHSKRHGWEGVWNGTHLKIALTAPAVDGKANAALLDFLSDYFCVPMRAISLLSGQTGRMKRLQVVFDSDMTAQKYEKDLNAFV